MCMDEKFADPPLHTAALYFLCTIFTEETKSRSEELTTLNCKNATPLSEMLNGPAASQLCELLLQVGGDAGHQGCCLFPNS